MNDATKKYAIHAAQLNQLLGSNARTLVASTSMVIILAYTQRAIVANEALFVWVLASVVLNFVRFFFALHCLKHPVSDAGILKNRLNQFRVGVILSSILWGSISFFMFSPEQLELQMFVIYILTGLSAGAVISYSVDIISAMSYTLLSLVPMLLRLFWFGDEIFIAMSVAGFLYVAYMIASIRNFNQNQIENITLRLDAATRENEIKQLAFFDSLTNLPNRRLLIDRLSHALVMSTRTNKRGALLFLDLDHFKVLNDSLGHDMGDLLLKQVSARLLACVRESDTVARFGGDEFVVMLEDLSEDHAVASSQVSAISKQIITSLNQPYQLNSFEYISTPSVGVAMFGEHGQSHDELLKHADIAMYQAKKAGRNVVRLFDFEMREEANSNARSA